MSQRLITLLLLIGCGDPPQQTDTDADSDTDTDTDSDTDTDTDTDSDTDTDPPHDTGHEDTDATETIVDCTPPAPPWGGQRLGTPRAYHGLAFDSTGGLVGSDQTNLIRATSGGAGALWIANISANGNPQQMDFLPTDELVIAIGNSVMKMSPSTGQTTLASGFTAYGIRIGQDGMVYAADQNVIRRLDPAGGSPAEVFLSAIDVPKVLDFTLDGRTMYVGTNNSNGAVYRVQIDANGDAILPPNLVGNTGGSWHDAINVDACGNVYINEYWTSTLYWIPAGTNNIQPLIQFHNLGASYDPYGHGFMWGSGVGSWDDHKVYMPLPYADDRVVEFDLGIPSKNYNGGNYTRNP